MANHTTENSAGESDGVLRVRHIEDHPLRRCYPYGGHDLVIEPTDDASAVDAAILSEFTRVLFQSDPHCRRIVAAIPASDDAALRAFTDGGFAAVTEVELEGAALLLLAVEPPRVSRISTALDDMPH